jgi:hypothetical protein
MEAANYFVGGRTAVVVLVVVAVLVALLWFRRR